MHAQDVVCCRQQFVVRQNEILQHPNPVNLRSLAPSFNGDVLVLGAIDLRRLEGFAIG